MTDSFKNRAYSHDSFKSNYSLPLIALSKSDNDIKKLDNTIKSFENLEKLDSKINTSKSDDSLKSYISMDSCSKSYDNLVDIYLEKSAEEKFSSKNKLFIKNKKIRRKRNQQIQLSSSPNLNNVIDIVKKCEVSPTIGIDLDYSFLEIKYL